MRILTEASGSLVSAYMIEAIRKAGYTSIASDIDDEAVGRYLADDFIKMPSKNDPELWRKMLEVIKQYKVDIVLPSLDETLIGWSEHKELFRKNGTYIMISEPSTLKICQDKWETYRFFVDNEIPTPATSLEQKYPLIKPRRGRGAQGVKICTTPVCMEGMISQEVVEGTEYTIDVFCDRSSNPVYIIPRKRIGVREGKSTGGIVEHKPEIDFWVNKICKNLPFVGPINIQCFITKDREVKFLEINPRIAGGMALGFAASENWISLIVEHFVFGKNIYPKPIRYGLKMKRYYAEVFVSED